MKITVQKPIALFLLTSLLVSCGGTASGSTDTTISSPDTAAESTSAEPSEYQKPSVDYNGETVRILETVASTSRWAASSYFDIACEEENGDPINDAQYKRNRKVEEELNVNLEQYELKINGGKTTSVSSDVTKLVMSGDDFAEAMFLNGGSYKALLAEDGMLTDLRSVDTLNLEASWWDEAARDAFTFGGVTKVMTGDISLYSSFAPMLLFFNKNVAEEYKLTDLYDLVRSGKWTLEKLEQYCTAVASDLNGDTVMDENDRFGMAEQAGYVADMLTSCAIRFTERDNSGNLNLALNSDRTAGLVEWIVTFLNNNDINNCTSHYSGKYSNVFYDLHIPMFKNDQLLFNYQQILISFELRAMDTDYGLLPMPKYDESQEKYLTSTSNSWITFVSIPVTSSKLDITGHVLDALGYYSQQYVTPEFIDTTVRAKSLRDDDSAEMLEIILDNIVYDIAFVYNWGSIRTMVNNLGYNNDVNFASAYAAAESTIKTEMQTTLELLEG